MDVLVNTIQEIVKEVQALKDSPIDQRKALALSLIQKIILTAPISDDEKKLVTSILPLLVEIEREVEGCIKNCLKLKRKS